MDSATTTVEPSIADILIRSRQTILDILEERGYDPLPYRNIAPEQILTLAQGPAPALNIILKKKPDSSSTPINALGGVFCLKDSSIRGISGCGKVIS
jgi:hypothetical protein